MFKLNSITFKDEETGKIIEVNIDGSVTSNQIFTPDEYCCTSLYTGIILGGGLQALTDFLNLKK